VRFFPAICLFFCLPLGAQGPKSADWANSFSEPKISLIYNRGEHLIYDCSGRFFACVNDVSFDLCQTNRETALAKRVSYLPCAPLRRYPEQADCFAQQYQQIDEPKHKAFCYNPRRYGSSEFSDL
jgi:hypothetical protein